MVKSFLDRLLVSEDLLQAVAEFATDLQEAAETNTAGAITAARRCCLIQVCVSPIGRAAAASDGAAFRNKTGDRLVSSTVN